MILRIGKPRSALIVAPHPDDETIGAYGLIRLLRLRRCRVRVIVVSDGAGSHRESVRWPRARLVAERCRESRRAMRMLGITAADMRFLGLPDGELGEARSHETRLRRAIMRTSDVDLLVAPVIDDAHPDHRFVATAAARTRLAAARRLGYLVWPCANLLVGAARGHPLRQARLAKRCAIKRYRTQCGVITDDPAGFSIAPHELRAFSGPAEMYREVR